MNSFSEMLRKITSSPYYDRMRRYTAPLADHFGINHFWYYRITDSGHYSYIGTHAAWNEYCFRESLLNHFPCIRHPSILQNGISLMKACQDPAYKDVLDTAWRKYNINFNLNLISSTSEGIEAFGFATRYQDPHIEERLLNELPLLRTFTKQVRENNQKLFQLLEDNQVDLSSQLGSDFYETPKTLALPANRQQFLRKIGLDDVLLLTPRELDVLKYISHGYPANYIAGQLRLRIRTIENYLATIKCKLSCQSKVELIQKAQEIESLGIAD